MHSTVHWLAGAALALSSAGLAQDKGATPAPATDVVGATAERERLIAQCSNHKFETTIVVDAAKNRTTKVKLCSEPGASDADWVKTLRAAIGQIEQRRMAPSAKTALIAELNAEIVRYQPPATTLGANAASSSAASPRPGGEIRAPAPTERFETSSLPPLTGRPATPPPAERFDVAALPPLASAPKAGPVAAPARPMAATIRCLERGESGAGMTCDFLRKDTVLAVRAVDGLEQGGRLRFVRRGDERGEVTLAALQPGAVARVRLPAELCTGVKTSKVELQLLAPGSSAVSARMGPYGLRC